jgi:hypothetical protein
MYNIDEHLIMIKYYVGIATRYQQTILLAVCAVLGSYLDFHDSAG